MRTKQFIVRLAYLVEVPEGYEADFECECPVLSSPCGDELHFTSAVRTEMGLNDSPSRDVEGCEIIRMVESSIEEYDG